MNTLTYEQFHHWLETSGKASRENDPQASANLFSLDAENYETPFAEPMIGRDAIYAYWDSGARRLKDKSSTFEILSITDNLGIARWQSKFTVIETGKRLALDCLFLMVFDDNEKCSLFREWWHIQDARTS